MNKTGNKCIECGQETYAIQLIDRGETNIHYNQNYTTDDFRSKPRTYHIDGYVFAELCDNCKRITLRAAPKD